MTTYRYLTAAEWGMTWARPPVAEAKPDTEAYVHHAGGAEWMRGDAVTIFRQLNTYAQQGKGYAAVDYDILVHYDPTTDVVTIGGGRQEWMSAATRDRNEQGEAICLCANTDVRAPLAVELEGIARAIVWGIQKGWIAKNAVVLGHRDNPAHPGATACPGRFLYAQLPAVRTRVAALLNPAPKPAPTPAPEDDTMLINNKILDSVDGAPPVSLMNVDPPDASTSRWFQAAVLAAMFKQLTGSKLYTQAAAEKLNELLRD